MTRVRCMLSRQANRMIGVGQQAEHGRRAHRSELVHRYPFLGNKNCPRYRYLNSGFVATTQWHLSRSP